MLVFPEKRFDIIPAGFEIKSYTQHSCYDQLYNIASTSRIYIKEHQNSLMVKVNSFCQMQGIHCKRNFQSTGIIQYQPQQVYQGKIVPEPFVFITRNIYSALIIENIRLPVGIRTKTVIARKDDHG